MERLKQIENYLDGNMSVLEKKKFENSLLIDQKLADELNFHKEVNEAILDDATADFRQTLKSIVEHDSVENKHVSRSLISVMKVPLVASILILIGLSLYNIIMHQNPSKLFADYYKPYNTDISTRSIERSKDNIQLSYYLYQEGDFQTSFEILKNYISSNFDDQTAHFYLGLDALELSLYDQAIDEFAHVEQDAVSPFALHARWYLAMTYLKTGKVDNAKILLQRLVKDENMYSAKAKKILKKL